MTSAIDQFTLGSEGIKKYNEKTVRHQTLILRALMCSLNAVESLIVWTVQHWILTYTQIHIYSC